MTLSGYLTSKSVFGQHFLIKSVIMRHFDTVPACDGRMDGQSDRWMDGFTIASTALCIASYADVL